MAAASVCSRHNSASAAGFTERSPTIFEEYKVFLGRRAGGPGGPGAIGSASALRRKSLRNKLLEWKIAFDGVRRLSHSTEFTLQHHCPRSRHSDCANARPFSRAEFTRTTPSHRRVAS